MKKLSLFLFAFLSFLTLKAEVYFPLVNLDTNTTLYLGMKEVPVFYETNTVNVTNILVTTNVVTTTNIINVPIIVYTTNVVVKTNFLNIPVYTTNIVTLTNHLTLTNTVTLTNCAPSITNSAPLVIINSPNDNASFAAPATVNISATATDSDGTVAKVEFYNNNVLVGTDVSSPYSLTLNNVNVGSYVLSAKAYDNNNANSLSQLVSISVTNIPPPPITNPPVANAVYIRQGANGNGADWANALSALPATLKRGSTYYVADGSYAAYTFDDAVSGTQYITVKKATVNNHGTDTGWNNSYGDGVADFPILTFSTAYHIFDGQVGGGPNNWTTGHGFKVWRQTAGQPTIYMNQGANNVTIAHVNIQGDGGDGDGASPNYQVGFHLHGNNNLTVRYCWIHDTGASLVFGSANKVTWEYNAHANNESTGGEHSSSIQMDTRFGSCADWTVRYNLWLQAEGTGCITYDAVGFSGANYFDIYGNVFYGPGGSWNVGNGVIAGWTGGGGEQFKNCHVYNNTFIGVYQPLTTFPNTYSGNSALNNLFYNCTTVSFAKFSHNYNHFINSGGTFSEANGSSSTGDPFVDQANLNFHLKNNTTSGSNLGAAYNVDPDGKVRTSWTRGAYEF